MKKNDQSTDLKSIFSGMSSAEDDSFKSSSKKTPVSKYHELDEMRLLLEGMRMMGTRRDSIAKQIGVPVHELNSFANQRIASPYTVDNLRKWIKPLTDDVFSSRLGRFLEAIGVKTPEEKKRFLLDMSHGYPSKLIADKLYDLADAVFSRFWMRSSMGIDELVWRYNNQVRLKETGRVKPKLETKENERPESNKYAALIK